MRKYRTFILRVMLDSEFPRRLRGSLQAVCEKAAGEQAALTFASGSSLLALLRMARPGPKPVPSNRKGEP